MENNAEAPSLYNNTGPVCAARMQRSARFAAKGRLPIRFDDLNAGAADQCGSEADTPDLRLWAQMLGDRVPGHLASLPGISRIAMLARDHGIEPAIYRWHLRRQARHVCN